MSDVYSVVQLMLTVNVPFGAAVLLIFFWRRLTVAAVWSAVGVSALLNILAPSLIAPALDAVTTSPALTARTTHQGRSVPVFFERVVRVDPADPASPLVGDGRFHVELWVLDKAGLDVADLTPSGRNAARFLYDGLFPFAVLLLVSLFTRRPEARRTALFFGKMKTPVGATPELEARAMADTAARPDRFDDTKLLGPRSQWEFARWDRVDTIGFLACLAVSFAILAAFWLVLRWAAGGP